MGVILFIMVFGYAPFDTCNKSTMGGNEINEIHRKIKNGFIPNIRNTAVHGYGPWFPDHIPSSPEVRDLISNLLNTNPRERYTAADALCHKWIQNGGKCEQFYFLNSNAYFHKLPIIAELKFSV